jgi:hypothetical protein
LWAIATRATQPEGQDQQQEPRAIKHRQRFQGCPRRARAAHARTTLAPRKPQV